MQARLLVWDVMRTLCAALGFLILSLAPARASTTFGDPPDSGNGNGYPFGSSDFIRTYQQVYEANLFDGPETIVGLSFFRTQILSGQYSGQTYRFSLSTTTASVNGLDLTAPGLNLGPDDTLFTEVTLSGPVPTGEIQFSGTPFLYDNSLGNLLLTIQILGTATYTGDDLYLNARNGTSGGQFSRAMWIANENELCCGTDNYGLTTKFTYASDTVPEPSTFVLGAIPLVVIAWRRRRSGFSI